MALTRRRKNQDATSTSSEDGAPVAANGAHARAAENKMAALRPSDMMSWFGFELSDLSSVSLFVKLLNRPTDPSSLGIMRILFGKYST